MNHRDIPYAHSELVTIRFEVTDEAMEDTSGNILRLARRQLLDALREEIEEGLSVNHRSDKQHKLPRIWLRQSPVFVKCWHDIWMSMWHLSVTARVLAYRRGKLPPDWESLVRRIRRDRTKRRNDPVSEVAFL